MPTKNGSFTMYLAPWQTRMAKDFLEKAFSRVILVPGTITCPASYKIPFRGLAKGDWVLYLTDEQIKIVKDKFKLKTPVTAINVNKELLENGSVTFR